MKDLLLTIVLIGAATGAIATILHYGWKVARGAYRMAKRIESTFELVDHELRPNSGSSLYDAIKRIDSRVEVLESIDRRGGERRSDSPASPFG